MITLPFVLNQELVLNFIDSITSQSHGEVHDFFKVLGLLLCDRSSLANRHGTYELNHEPSAVLSDDLLDSSELLRALVVNILGSAVDV